MDAGKDQGRRASSQALGPRGTAACSGSRTYLGTRLERRGGLGRVAARGVVASRGPRGVWIGIDTDVVPEAVTTALKEYVQRRRQQRILDLVGQIEYEPNYDHKALRRGGRRT